MIGPYGTPTNTNPTVTSTSSEILIQTPGRSHLLFYNPGQEKVYIAFNADAVYGEGAYFVPEEGHLLLEIETERDIWMTASIHAITSSASIALGITEVKYKS
jgi:hypothetical protein